MRKVVILTLVTLFTCVEYSQAQTTEKEMTRQEKKRLRKLWTKCYFRKPKRQQTTKPLYWKRTEFTLNSYQFDGLI